MQPIYQIKHPVTDLVVDRFGKLKLSSVLYFAQEAAGQHSALLGADYDTLMRKRLFWAVTRHKVQITRLPRLGETITLETWPMPTTRVAYPRSLVARDADGEELFRSISLWVLMDMDSRGMILPGKSGVEVEGTLTGAELALPHSLMPKGLDRQQVRTVTYSCLDRNGHMNNTRYLDWVEDLLPSAFHGMHTAREFTVCYASEALENQSIRLDWAFAEDGCLQVDAHREKTDDAQKNTRVFSVQVMY